VDRVCIIGDSISHGTGDSSLLGWPGIIFKHHPAITLYNLGVRGDTSKLISARWELEARARLPEVQRCGLIFSFGTNDAAIESGQGIRVALEDSIAYTKNILIQAQNWLPSLMIGPVPVIDVMQPFNSGAGVFEFNSIRIAQYNGAYQKLARELDIPYLDVFNTLKSDPIWIASQTSNDGVHPRQEGYQVLANLIDTWDAFQRFSRVE